MFGTPIGHILSKRVNWKKRENDLVKLAVQRDSELKEKIHFKINLENSQFDHFEGGDTIICDVDSLAIGINWRLDPKQFKFCLHQIFKEDENKQLETISLVKMPDKTGLAHIHLDTTFNWVDEEKALVQPYYHDSEIVDFFPPRQFLGEFLDIYLHKIYKNLSNPIPVPNVASAFEYSGETHVYRRDRKDKPKRVIKEKSFIDYLIKQEKLEKDEVIMASGKPKKKGDFPHLITAQKERETHSSNILAIKPGHIIAGEENHRTIDALKEHNIHIKTITLTGMSGGPRCMTCELQREAF